MEWMRLNTERDRLYRYKDIVGDQSKLYYNILDKYYKLIEMRKELPGENEFKQRSD